MPTGCGRSSHEFLDEMTAVGDAQAVRSGIERYRSAGVTSLENGMFKSDRIEIGAGATVGVAALVHSERRSARTACSRPTASW
jgi:glucokinase